MKKKYYQLKKKLKAYRLIYRRWRVATQWGSEALENSPKLVGIALPKGGSHFIHQVLSGFADIGPFIKPGFPPVNRFEDNSHLSEKEITANLENMGSGEIRYGYLPCREPYLSVLTGEDRANVFIYRDPRDLIVSHVFYAADMYQDHGMHDHYNEELQTMEERINFAIMGSNVPGLELPSVSERYSGYLPWLELPNVFQVRFENLILNRRTSLSKLIDYVQTFGINFSVAKEEAIDRLERSIQPKKAGTFRKGQPGNWEEHFTEENKQRFKTAAGDLLVKLGYEKDQNW